LYIEKVYPTSGKTLSRSFKMARSKKRVTNHLTRIHHGKHFSGFETLWDFLLVFEILKFFWGFCKCGKWVVLYVWVLLNAVEKKNRNAEHP